LKKETKQTHTSKEKRVTNVERNITQRNIEYACVGSQVW